MNFRNVGLSTGLSIGVPIIALGAFFMYVSAQRNEYGLVFMIGLAILIPGVAIVLITLFVWLFFTLYASLDAGGKRVFRGIIISIAVVSIGAVILDDYQQSRPEAIAERLAQQRAEEEALATQKAAKARAAEEKLQGFNQLLVGSWAFAVGKVTGVITYHQDGHYSVIHHNGVQQRPGVWNLERDLQRDVIEVVRVTSNCPGCTVQRNVVHQLDAEMLVIENSLHQKMELRRVEEPH